MTIEQNHTPENPFCSRNIRPGATPFFFNDGENAESLVRRLQENGWRGEIVGRHGTGKSTLLAALVPALHDAGRKILLVELHDGQRRLPLDLERQCRSEPFNLLIVDGYEQLSRWSRFKLKRLCRRHGWGLLVAVHESVGFAEIHRTCVSEELAAKIVEHLMEERTPPFGRDEISAAFARHRGDVREMLFDFYDVFEAFSPKTRE